MRKVVVQGTGETLRHAHLITDQAAAVFHELCEGAHGGTLGLKWR
jgi:hypothetical protein